MGEPLDKSSKQLKRNASGSKASKWNKNKPPEAAEMDAELQRARDFLAWIVVINRQVSDNKKKWADNLKRAREAKEHVGKQVEGADALLVILRGLRETVKASQDAWSGLADQIIALQQSSDEKAEAKIKKLHSQADVVAKRGNKAMDDIEKKFRKVSAALQKAKSL